MYHNTQKRHITPKGENNKISREDAKRPVERFVMQANKYEDTEETVYSAEIYLLRKLFERASDFENAQNYPEFAKLNPDTEEQLRYAVQALYDWYSDGDA